MAENIETLGKQRISLKEIPSIQERISYLSDFTKNPESKNFDCTQVFSYLSDNNQKLLSPISEQFNLYLNCLQQVTRWKNHVYDTATKDFNDNDYDHTLGMLKISQDIKSLGLEKICFDDIEIMILAHDGGEIITDDISLIRLETVGDNSETIKKIEPKTFVSCILRSLKEKDHFETRSKVKHLYKRYDSRKEKPRDTEAHLVKLIDMFQGNEFGLKNVYSKKKLIEIYGDENIPTDPEKFIIDMFKKELTALDGLLQHIDNQSDKQKIFYYCLQNHFNKYNNPDYQYQHLHLEFQSQIDELSTKLS